MSLLPPAGCAFLRDPDGEQKFLYQACKSSSMKDHTQFRPDGAIAVLLLGAPGSGKTNLAFEFDRPYFMDWGDANLKSAVERHPGKPFFWDRIDQDDAGKDVPHEQRWERGATLLKAAGADPKVGTLVDDSLSMMQNALCDHIIHKGSQAESPLIIGGVKVMTRSMWNAFKDLLTKRIIQARSYGKPYIMTCHEKVDADDMTAVKIYRPALSGQLGDNIASLFSDFWSCETDPNADKKKYANGVRYFVRTVPTSRIKLKCSCGLPAEFEFTGDAFAAHMAARQGGAQQPAKAA